MYAWYNVLVSPSTFAGLEDITKGDDDGGGGDKNLLETLFLIRLKNLRKGSRSILNPVRLQ